MSLCAVVSEKHIMIRWVIVLMKIHVKDRSNLDESDES